jgi:hypothetical protein
MRLQTAPLLMMAVLVSINAASSEPSSNVATIRGRIVAYSSPALMPCLNGNAYWSMLIRVQDHTPDISARYLTVRFSLPCKQPPKWLNHKQPLRDFHLKRDHANDAVLKEFIECTAASRPCPKLRMWKLVPSAEHEMLPFGRTLPSYECVDLPLAPVV